MIEPWQHEDLERQYRLWWALCHQRLRLVRLLARRGGRPARPTPDVKSGAAVPPPSRRAAPSGGGSV